MNPKPNKPIYLDYAATTPVDRAVVDVMNQCLTFEGDFGNPSSLQHDYGRKAHELVEKATVQVANLIGSQPADIIFTSGATESNNLAIKGIADFYQNKGKHIITMATEHDAVLSVCQYLEKLGFEVTYLKPKKTGVLDLNELENAIRQDTVLISIMHVNNETGVIQDIQSIGEIVKKHPSLFHIDAAQSVGKIPIDVTEMPIDLLSFSAHKFYGPKGIGALYKRNNVQLTPLIHGSGQQNQLRSGTLPVHQIAGFGKACELALSHLDDEAKRLTVLRDQLWQGLQALNDVHLNGDLNHLAPGYLNVTFDYIHQDALLTALTDVAVSSKSACTQSDNQPSHVLSNMGLRERAQYNAIRFSLGRMTTKADIKQAILHVTEVVNRLRALSPLWHLAKEGVDVKHYAWERVR